jgi:F-type H+-transporting ATPase subunit gamma
VGAEEHPLLRTPEEKKVLLLVVTGDKGLAGAFNTNVVKATTTAIAERGWNDVQLIPIGKKANDYFRRRPLAIRHQAVNIFQALQPEHADEIAAIISADFIDGKVDSVYGIYNEFRSVISQVVRVERLLPLERQALEADAAVIDYLYEPGPDRILEALLPKHIAFQIYRMLLDSAAAEHGARMTAMESATKNAGELIDSLTLTYNRARQASITRELIEIVSGAAALE